MFTRRHKYLVVIVSCCNCKRNCIRNRFGKRLLLLCLDFVSHFQIKLWDTAGQDRYNSLTESYYRGKNAVVIVFAVNCRESFLSVYRFIKELKSNDYSPDAVYFLVGNKIDLKHDEVSQTQVDDCQKSNPGVFAAYLRTSAKKSKTVDKLLNVVAQTLVSNRVKPVRRDNLFRPIYDSPTNKVDCF